MLNFLPIIFQDELLVSIFSRYKNMCGMTSKQAFEKDLFDRLEGRKSVWLPQNLSAFVANLPPNSKITVEELIQNHTMYPYYTAFLSNEKSNSIFDCMTRKSGKAIESMVGLGGNKVKPSNVLRYCPLCFQIDMERYGESCWRRLPQIPGAIYCPIHEVLYKDSNVLITESRNAYICADEDVCNSELAEDVYPTNYKELNLRYMENASYLLFHNQNRLDLSFIIQFYIDRLREKQLASNIGNLYIDRLLEAFMQYYPSDYLELMQSEVNLEQKANWLRIFVRSNNKNRSPLRHLLFLQFLNVDVQTLFNTDNVIGKRSITINRSPLFSIEERRKAWLKLIEENPEANRSQLKEISKGLHTWICAHDWNWYDEVTPKVTIRKNRIGLVDWEKRDEEYLQLAQQAVQTILKTEGKPIRITPRSIRYAVGIKRSFHHPKLVKTGQYLKEVSEDIQSYRIRKIKWAINEMIKNGQRLTVYKIQLYAGFGEGNQDIKKEIERILNDYDRVEFQSYKVDFKNET